MKSVWNRIARRQWTCGWCGRTIHVGQSYLQISNGRYCCTPPDQVTP